MTPGSKNHQRMMDQVKAYLDGELSWLARRAVQRHLATCAACRKEKAIMEELTQQLQAAATLPPLDAALHSRILDSAAASAAVADATSPPASPPVSPQRAPLLRRPLRLTASAIGLVGAACAFFAIVLINPSRKVQTVFNVANNALTTEGGEVNDQPSAQAAAPGLSAGAAGSAKVAGAANSGFAGALRGSAAAADDGRKVYRQAALTLEVSQIEASADKVIGYISGSGGYVVSNDIETGEGGTRTATVEARVPVNSFDKALRVIGSEGHIIRKTVTGEDVTMRYANAAAAHQVMQNELAVSETQLRAALQRAVKHGHPGQVPWEMRDEVRRLRVQDAEARARFQAVRRLADMAAITIAMTEKAQPVGKAGFVDSTSATLGDAGARFMQAAQLPVNCIIWIAAYSPLWLPLLLGGLYIKKLQTPR